MRGIVDLFAQYERALIRARTKAALAVKAARGECTGGVPYGFRLAADGLHVEENPEERALVECVRALRAEGRTLRAIAADLDARGAAPRGGGRWHPQTVANILRAARGQPDRPDRPVAGLGQPEGIRSGGCGDGQNASLL